MPASAGRSAAAQVRPNTGPFQSEHEALREVVRRLVDGLQPEAVWLFGSRARGDYAPDGDFDILVVTRFEDGEAGFDFERAYAPIRGLGVGCDVVPCRADDFLADQADPTSLGWQVARFGKPLYVRNEENRSVAGPR